MPKIKDEAVKLIIDMEMSSYEALFDFDWARRFGRATDNKAISPAASNLLMSWRGIGNTFRMPWLMVRQLRGFARGFMKANRPKAPVVLRAIDAGLSDRMGSQLSHKQLTNVRSVVSELAERATFVNPDVSEIFSIEDVWREYVRQPEMRISLWGSQQMCYGAIYFAYEAFLLAALRLKTGDPSLKLWPNAAKKVITDNLGSNTFLKAWDHPAIERARLVRHAITHNGAKETDLLRDHGHCIEMTCDLTLHIRPDDNKTLMGTLQSAAEVIAKEWT